MVESDPSQRALSKENVCAFAGNLGVPPERLFETSAASGKGVIELFDAVAHSCSKSTKKNEGIMLEGGNQQKTGGCGC